jgi:deazaflavin-dependent oxidoreductase (nitroreductase family)
MEQHLPMTSRFDDGPWRHFYRVVNPVVKVLVQHFGARGTSDDLLRTLSVRGRRSGRIYQTPVRVTVNDGRRFIMGMFSTAQWVKNLRAAGEAELRVGKAVERIRATEITGRERREFINAYARDPKQAKRLKFALRADPAALGSEELHEAMAPFAVFRVESA